MSKQNPSSCIFTVTPSWREDPTSPAYTPSLLSHVRFPVKRKAADDLRRFRRLRETKRRTENFETAERQTEGRARKQWKCLYIIIIVLSIIDKIVVVCSALCNCCESDIWLIIMWHYTIILSSSSFSSLSLLCYIQGRTICHGALYWHFSARLFQRAQEENWKCACSAPGMQLDTRPLRFEKEAVPSGDRWPSRDHTMHYLMCLQCCSIIHDYR